MVGSSVGGYRILEKIRDGGAGTVFKAQGQKGELVALKVISEAWNDQRDRRKAFKREAEVAQKLVHPSVVRVFSYSDGPPRPHIVMEYVAGENLKYTLWHRQQVLEGRRMSILKQCADALYYIHTQGVIHRDVKPENFLVNAEGGVRLIDFSIAQTRWDRFLFSFGKTVDGTPLYMSPEQIRNDALDPRSDMYSFGVMVFELMTRRPPFIGASLDSILEKHLKSSPPSMRSVSQEVSPELDELVTKMLSKRASDRPGDMSFAITVLARLARKEEEARLREGRATARVAAGAATPVPGTRAIGTRPTPSSIPAVPGAAPPGAKPTPGPVPAVPSATPPTKPPTSTKLPAAAAAPAPPAKPPSSTSLTPAAPVGAPVAAAVATTAGPAGEPGTTRIPTKVRVLAPRDGGTKTSTKVRPPGTAPSATPAASTPAPAAGTEPAAPAASPAPPAGPEGTPSEGSPRPDGPAQEEKGKA